MENSMIKNEYFGDLEFDKSTRSYKKTVSTRLFNRKWTDIELYVDVRVDKGSCIHHYQEQSYQFFKQNNQQVEEKIKAALLEYYQLEIEQDKEITAEQVISQMRLEAIIFPLTYTTENEVIYGFLFDADFEPEHGIGIQVCNGDIEVGFQELLI